MSSEVDQALVQPKEDEVQSENERQVILNVKQFKSIEIVRSAFTIFRKDTRCMLLMMLSIVPLFVFMVFYEIRLQKAIVAAPEALVFHLKYVYFSNKRIDYSANNNKRMEFFYGFLQLSLLHLVIYPLLEILSMITTIKAAAKVRAGEKQATLKEVFNLKQNLQGPFMTCLYVHLLSTLTLLGPFWIAVSHSFEVTHYSFAYNKGSIEFYMYVFSVAVRSVIFLTLLYKYLEWSSFWTMAIVISALENVKGMYAILMSEYYGKHSKRTGFQLMLTFLAFSIVLRLSCLYIGSYNGSITGVWVTSIVIGLVSLANLVKWIAFVLYFYDCKQHTMEKKNDEEVSRAVNVV